MANDGLDNTYDDFKSRQVLVSSVYHDAKLLDIYYINIERDRGRRNEKERENKIKRGKQIMFIGYHGFIYVNKKERK